MAELAAQEAEGSVVESRLRSDPTAYIPIAVSAEGQIADSVAQKLPSMTSTSMIDLLHELLAV